MSAESILLAACYTTEKKTSQACKAFSNQPWNLSLMMLQAVFVFCKPVISFQTSQQTFFFSPPACLCLSRLFLSASSSIQESVVQQLDPSGRGESGHAGGSTHTAAGPQLHQSHQWGGLQGPQGSTSPVSAPPVITKPQITSPPSLSLSPLMKR